MKQTPSEAPSSEFGVEHDFGFVPTFLYRGRAIPSGALVSALEAGGPLTLDHEALNVFLRTDLFLDGGTPFREVRRVSPPPTIVPPVEMTREQAMDGFVDLFRQSVARRLTRDAVLALSGGRDSRHILFELHRLGHLPRYAVTIGASSTTDLEIADQVASAVGVEHRKAWLKSTIEGARYTVRATDLMSMQHAWFADVARRRDGGAWWDGIAGDVLSAGHFLEDWNVRLFQQGKLDELSDRLVRPGRVPYFRDQRSFPREAAVDALRRELARHVGAANAVGSYYFWNRTRVNIAASAFGLLRPNGQTTLAPFLDRDLWRHLASIPLRHVIDQQLHTDVIRREYPAFAHIEYSHKQPPGIPFYWRRSARMLGCLVMRPSLRSVPTAVRTLRSLLIPSRASDIEWIVGTWVFGEEVERIRREASR